ncbi:MAG TPA: hypothetical protein PK794_12250 [Armatimonadota bacterium]|nr:hypothetical protein [Armatimonadota bacterium]
MTMPTGHRAPLPNRGLWLLLAPLLLVGAGLTISEYLRARSAMPPPPPAPAPAPAPPPAPEAGKPIPLAESITERIDLLIYDALVPPIPKTEHDLIAALGPPVRTGTRSVPNRNTANSDTLRTLYYPGMSVDFLKVSHTGGEFPTGLTVTGPKVWVKWDLNVGVAEKKVTTTLGPPRSRTDATLTYEYSVAPSTVTFHLRSGVVAKIVWSYYVD